MSFSKDVFSISIIVVAVIFGFIVGILVIDRLDSDKITLCIENGYDAFSGELKDLSGRRYIECVKIEDGELKSRWFEA